MGNFHPLENVQSEGNQLYAATLTPNDYETLKQKKHLHIVKATKDKVNLGITAASILVKQLTGKTEVKAEEPVKKDERYLVLASKDDDGHYHQKELYKGHMKGGKLIIDTFYELGGPLTENSRPFELTLQPEGKVSSQEIKNLQQHKKEILHPEAPPPYEGIITTGSKYDAPMPADGFKPTRIAAPMPNSPTKNR